MSAASEWTPELLKRCCATAYEGDWVRLLLGDSFHPGGRGLTRRLAEAMTLRRGERVLDVASGAGSTTVLLARGFGVTVEGVDLSERSVEGARHRAAEAGLDGVVRFMVGDAERLPVADRSVDAVVCECSLCLFPDKETAVGELSRALRAGGRVGITDVVADQAELPEELRGIAAHVACVGDARSLGEYAALLENAGLRVNRVENHAWALDELIDRVVARLTALEMLDLPSISGVNLDNARRLLSVAAQAVRVGTVGYALLVAERPSSEAGAE